MSPAFPARESQASKEFSQAGRRSGFHAGRHPIKISIDDLSHHHNSQIVAVGSMIDDGFPAELETEGMLRRRRGRG